MESVGLETRLGRLLSWCQDQEASDLHARAGKPFTFRVHGRLQLVPDHVAPVPSEDTLDSILREALSTNACSKIHRQFEVDLSFYCGPVRYRANFARQMGRQSFSMRRVPPQRLKLADLHLPVSLRNLLERPRGLILVTGPTGQGKSTTARALLQEINETSPTRVITIEDPIEYVFEDQQATFEQREVGIDTASFAEGIRNAMRQDPNVLFVGEMRDRDSIWAALQAAETGHLVMTTLHADSVPQAIGRIREFYPSSEQSNVSSLLGRNLNAILCQRLLPITTGTRVPCLEVMRRNKAVQEAITQNDLALLSGIIEVSVEEGMHSFDQYLTELLAAGVIERETAERFAVNRHKLELALRGVFTSQGILRPDPNR